MHRNPRGVSSLIVILCVAVLLAALVAWFVVERRAPLPGAASGSVPPPALNADQAARLPWLEFTGLQMSAAQNFLGNTVIYLDARVTNQGTKTIRRLDVQLEFVDTLHQVVLRETAHALSARSAPLAPGETRAFQVSFEHLPEDWNQAPPTITPTHVEY